MRINFGVTLQAAAAAGPGDTRPRISGRIVPFGVYGNPSSGPWRHVRFAAGSLRIPDPPGRVKLLRDHAVPVPIGVMISATPAADGIDAVFALGSSADALEALQLARDGILDGLSVGVSVADGRPGDGDTFEITSADLVEVSMVPIPSYDDARVVDIAAQRGQPMDTVPNLPPTSGAPAPAAPAAPAVPAAAVPPAAAPAAAAPGQPPPVTPAAAGPAPVPFTAEGIAAAVCAAMAAPDPSPPVVRPEPPTAGPDAPHTRTGIVLVDAHGYGRNAPAFVTAAGRRITAGDFFAAYFAGRKGGDYGPFRDIEAALAHEVTSLIPGLLPQQILGPTIGAAEPVRRVWNSLTVRVMPQSAGKFQRPRITQHTAADIQAAEKTEVASQPLELQLDDVVKATIASALNLSVQAIDWSSPAVLDMVIADFMKVYAVRSDVYATAALMAAANVTPAISAETEPAAINAAFYQAAAAVYAAGDDFEETVPDTVWMSPDVWATLGSLADTTGRPISPFLGPTNTLGTSDPGDQQAGRTGSMPHVVSRRFAAGTLIVGDSNQLEMYEDRRGLLRADEPAILGVQVATYGYVGSYSVNDAAFQKITLTPALPLSRDTESKGKK